MSELPQKLDWKYPPELPRYDGGETWVLMWNEFSATFDLVCFSAVEHADTDFLIGVTAWAILEDAI